MNDKELDAMLMQTLGTTPAQPACLDARLRGTLSLARREGRAVSVWWLPLVVSLLTAVGTTVPAILMPTSLLLLVATGTWASALWLLALTVVGLLRFDLRKRGSIVL